METDKPFVVEVRTTQKVYQNWTYKVTIQPGTKLPTDMEEWASILYNGEEGFEVSEGVHETKYDNFMEEVIDHVFLVQK